LRRSRGIEGARLGTPIRIVDIGAMHIEGDRPSYASLLEAGACEIVGFEPNEPECTALSELHGKPNQFIPAVIGVGDVREFRVCKMRSRSSVYEPNEPLCRLFNGFYEGSEVVERTAVRTVRLDDVPLVRDPDFVKMDVQGAELDVIRGGESTLADALVIETEVEFVEQYMGQPLFGEVDQALRRLGFMFHTVLRYGSHPLEPVVGADQYGGVRQWLWADVVYVRDILSLASIRDEKLLKMAILLHSLYESYDLTFHILNIIDERSGTSMASGYLSGFAGSGDDE